MERILRRNHQLVEREERFDLALQAKRGERNVAEAVRRRSDSHVEGTDGGRNLERLVIVPIADDLAVDRAQDVAVTVDEIAVGTGDPEFIVPAIFASVEILQ